MAVKQVFNTSAELDYPKVLPTLDLDFANTKTLDPRIEFTRASGGSYVGADGLIKYAGVNEARFDHDPVTGECLGLLIEESRTNLSLNSQDFTDNTSNTAWKTSVSRATLIANTGIDDPSGGTTASRWASGTKNSEQLIYHLLPSELSQGVAYTASCWIRRVSGTGGVRFLIGDNIGDFVTSQLDSVPYGTWVRCHYTRIITGDPAVDFTGRAYIEVYPDGSDPTTIDIWGYQMEQGSFPTSYIPTQGSTRTRQPDNAQITGKNFSEWYNSSEWTLMIAARRNYSGNFLTYPNLARVNDGTNNNNVGFYGALNNTQFTNYSVNSGGVNQTPYVAINVPTTSQFKMIQALKENDSTFGGNGTLTTTDTSVLMPVGVNQLFIGSDGGSSWWGGTISQLTYYPKRLPNSQHIALTE